ncbi:MAG: VTT domain-containing protein [Acidobacteria bacterium]|nr:VTT domain-containing protein [Acidobacteriota bacterium]
MIRFLLDTGGILRSLQALLASFGALGIVGIALLDAAFIPIPGGADVAVMTLSHLHPELMPIYVLAAVIGSTIGCLVPYWIGRKAGEAGLRKFNAEKRARVIQLIDRYDWWAMSVGAVLPPPFPFKIFLLTAGVFRMKVWRFLLALAFGRFVRFGLLGWLAVNFGDRAAIIFKQHYPKIGLGIAVAIIAICLINILRKRRQGKNVDQRPVASGH